MKKEKQNQPNNKPPTKKKKTPQNCKEKEEMVLVFLFLGAKTLSLLVFENDNSSVDKH